MKERKKEGRKEGGMKERDELSERLQLQVEKADVIADQRRKVDADDLRAVFSAMSSWYASFQ